jgi:hypothetical protein
MKEGTRFIFEKGAVSYFVLNFVVNIFIRSLIIIRWNSIVSITKIGFIKKKEELNWFVKLNEAEPAERKKLVNVWIIR